MAQTAKQSWIESVVRIAERAAAREGIEVWDVECLGSGNNRVIRVFIDKPGGVSHSDCESISQQIGTVLDVEDVVPGQSYRLEVSSPGLERKLRNEADFRRFAGQKARVVLAEPVDGQRRFDGVIAASGDNGTICLETPQGKSIRFRMDQVEKANLKFEW